MKNHITITLILLSTFYSCDKGREEGGPLPIDYNVFESVEIDYYDANVVSKFTASSRNNSYLFDNIEISNIDDYQTFVIKGALQNHLVEVEFRRNIAYLYENDNWYGILKTEYDKTGRPDLFLPERPDRYNNGCKTKEEYKKKNLNFFIIYSIKIDGKICYFNEKAGDRIWDEWAKAPNLFDYNEYMYLLKSSGEIDLEHTNTVSTPLFLSK